MYLKQVKMIRFLIQPCLLRKTILILSRVGLASVDFIFLHWLSNTFLSTSLIPHYNYICKPRSYSMNTIIMHWNTPSKTVPILHNYTTSNTAVYITFRKFYENSRKIHILYINFRKVHANWSKGNILNAETIPVAARQSLRCPVNVKVASLISRWLWSWCFPKWTGSKLSEAFTQPGGGDKRPKERNATTLRHRMVSRP